MKNSNVDPLDPGTWTELDKEGIDLRGHDYQRNYVPRSWLSRTLSATSVTVILLSLVHFATYEADPVKRKQAVVERIASQLPTGATNIRRIGNYWVYYSVGDTCFHVNLTYRLLSEVDCTTS